MTEASPQPTGFATDWLALREPVDHSSRNRAVEDALIHWLRAATGAGKGRDDFRILDLGCGTGSTLRALAPRFARQASDIRQHWHLADADPLLLADARQRCRAIVQTGILLSFHHADLADADRFEALIDTIQPDLVTGSALIDLVSAAWLGRLVEMASERRFALHFALNYSGEEFWSPPHRLDAVVLERFNAHQSRDKGFGPALGGAATDHLATLLEQHRFEVTVGRSDWRLDDAHRALIGMLAAGIAGAAGEAGGIASEDIAVWLTARKASNRVVVGHLDIFAAPLPAA